MAGRLGDLKSTIGPSLLLARKRSHASADGYVQLGVQAGVHCLSMLFVRLLHHWTVGECCAMCV
jgi:hypothetical protein